MPSPGVRRPSTRALVAACAALLVVAVAAPQALAGGARVPTPAAESLDPPDPYFPTLGNSGYDVAHYDLAIVSALPEPDITATVTLRASATRRLTSFNLDLTGMTVQRVTVDGAKARFEHEEGELVVRPQTPIEADAEFEVRVRYSGPPGTSTIPGLGAPNGWMQTEEGATTLNEPDGASQWFPANDHPADKATYRFRITVPDPLVAIANGQLLSRRAGKGVTTFTWDAKQPMASYLTQIVIGDLELATAGTAEGVSLRNAFSPSTKDAALAAAAQTPAMMEFFVGMLGPFPFDTYGIVVPDVAVAGLAFEAQTFSLFAASALNEPILAHELAHQWFGDSVTPASWQDIWLNEGFATYFEWIWADHIGDEPFERSVDRARDLIGRELDTATDDPGLERMFSFTPYERGALTLVALRSTVGDADFDRILRTYLTRYGGSVATTEDFVAIASDVAGRDLTAQFREWFGPGPFPEIPDAPEAEL